MRVILAEHFADHAGRFAILRGRAQPHVVHGVQDAALNGLQAIARIRQRTRDDDAHGVIEIGRSHLLLDVDTLHRAGVVRRVEMRAVRRERHGVAKQGDHVGFRRLGYGVGAFRLYGRGHSSLGRARVGVGRSRQDVLDGLVTHPSTLLINDFMLEHQRFHVGTRPRGKHKMPRAAPRQFH